MNQESIKSHIEELEAKDNLTKKERKKLKRFKGKIVDKESESINKYKNIILWVLAIGIVIGVVAGTYWYFSSQPKLPPTSQQGHVEASPQSHILDEPMPESIQRHMLEHADGEGAPGIIVQYNCDDFDCESNLVDKLKKIVNEYPENVYLAPGSYNGKIILTREGKIEILDSFNEEKIRSFIN